MLAVHRAFHIVLVPNIPLQRRFLEMVRIAVDNAKEPSCQLIFLLHAPKEPYVQLWGFPNGKGNARGLA